MALDANGSLASTTASRSTSNLRSRTSTSNSSHVKAPGSSTPTAPTSPTNGGVGAIASPRPQRLYGSASRINGLRSAASSRPSSPLSSNTYLPGQDSSMDSVDEANVRDSPLGPWLHSLYSSLEERLKTQASKPGRSGSVARYLLDRGQWVEEIIYDEIELRANAIGGLDNMWLLLSEATNGSFNPVCAATYTFKEKITVDDAIKTSLAQADNFPRYRQKLANVGRRWHGATFVDDPEFDIRNHVKAIELPGNPGKRELDDFTADFIAGDWDYDRPLWNAVLISNYSDDQGSRSALVIRGHHTMADGQGFVMSQLLSTSYGPELRKQLNEGKATLRRARRGTAQPSKLHKALKPLDPYRNTLALQLVMLLLFWSISVVSWWLDLYGSFRQGLHISFWFLLTCWRQRYATAEYKGERVKGKEFAVSHAFPMSDVKLIQKAFSGPSPGGFIDRALGRRGKYVSQHLTLNDILVTVISDVIADEIEHQEFEPLPGPLQAIKRAANSFLPNPIAIMIPISVRPLGDTSLRNWSTGSVAYLPAATAKNGLPVGPKSMHRRLHGNSASLSVLKRGWLPTIAFYMIELTGQAPILFPSPLWKPVTAIVTYVTELVMTSFTAVLTNVPGPPAKVELAGSEVQQWSASPPQAGKSTLGIGVISYADTVCITIAADHVEASSGVAHRLCEQFERRWAQYREVAQDIMDKAEKRRRRRQHRGEARG